MSRIGNPYDNAKAERFMRTLKEEEVDGRAYRDIIDARTRIGEFIERVYNSQRLHSALDYLSPDEYDAGLARLRQQPLTEPDRNGNTHPTGLHRGAPAAGRFRGRKIRQDFVRAISR